jgi:hypothetical protein
MFRWTLLALVLGVLAPALAATRVLVQDYETAAAPQLWGVNQQPDNAVSLVTDDPLDGNKCLKLHYNFVPQEGKQQYLGIAHGFAVKAPIHTVFLGINGDGAGCRVSLQLGDASGETHQVWGPVVDFQGWKEVAINLDGGHETWGGDNNGQIDLPLRSLTLIVSPPKALPALGNLYFDAISVASEKSADETITKLTKVRVLDYETDETLPKLWGVNQAADNAASLTPEAAKTGKQALKLHYHFLDKAGQQYLGLPNPLKVKAPIHKLYLHVKGDNSGCGLGVQVADASGETHQFRGGKVDFDGWKELSIDLDAGHETWGGDNNRTMDYPITGFTLIISTPGKACAGDLYFDSIGVDSEKGPNDTLLRVRRQVIEDYTAVVVPPGLWGVNTPEGSGIAVSKDEPFEDKPSLHLTYHFTEAKNEQYLGLPHTVSVLGPLHKLHVMVKGDGAGCGLGVQVSDVSGETHQFRLGTVAFTGWKELTADLDAGHETWGGDKNRKIDYPITGFTLTVSTPRKEARGHLYVAAVAVDTERADAGVLQVPPGARQFTVDGKLLVTVGPNARDGIYWGADAKPALDLSLLCVAGESAKADVAVRLLDLHEAPLGEQWKQTVEVKAETPVRQRVPLKLDRYGLYYVEVSAGAVTQRLNVGWLTAKATPWADSPFAVCTHFDQRKHADPAWTAQKIADMGASWVRDGLAWGGVETGEKGHYALNAYYEGCLKAVRAARLNALGIVCYGNRLYNANGDAPATDDERAAFAKYAAWCAEHLAPYFDALEVWNEPDNAFWQPKPHPANYAALAKRVYATIKGTPAAAKMPVGVGATSWFNWSFIDTILQEGAGRQLDFYTLHPYGLICTSPDFMKSIDLLIEKLDAHGAKGREIWFTEFGYVTSPEANWGMAADRAALLSVREYLLALSRPRVKRLFYYDFQDDGTNPKDPECNFGLIKLDGSPKVGFVAYNTMARLLAHTAFTRMLATGNGVCEEFTGPGGGTLVAWAAEGADTLSLSVTQPRVTVTDWMGNAATVAAVGGRITLPLGKEPIYITGYGTAKPAAPLASLGGAVLLTPDVANTLTLRVDPALQGTAWTITVPDTWTLREVPGTPLTWTLTAPADTPQGSDFGVTVTSATGIGTGAQVLVKDPVIVTGTNTTGTMMTLTLANPFEQPVNATYQVTRGETAAEAVPVALAAKSTKRIDVPVENQQADRWLCVPMDVTVRVGTWRKFVRTLGGVTPCYPIAPSAVNAETPRWAGYKPCLADAAYQMATLKGMSWAGPADLSAKFWLGSDGERLYLTVVAKDQTHAQKYAAEDAWMGDSVQCALFANGTRFEFTLAMSAKGEALFAQSSPNEKVPADQVAAAVKRVGEQTCYDLTLPWQALGVTPNVTPLHFALLVNDNDGNGRKGWIEWFQGIGFTKDPTLYAPVAYQPAK